ncbi:unnamed protein product [Coccothraustes coccothraustes]
MQALRHTEDANLELSGAKRRSRAAFGRSRALASTASGTMLTQEPRFGEHCYRHDAMCAKKQLLPLLEPQSAAVAET